MHPFPYAKMLGSGSYFARKFFRAALGQASLAVAVCKSLQGWHVQRFHAQVLGKNGLRRVVMYGFPEARHIRLA